MGCDIHIAIQVQESDGRWVEVPYQTALYDFQIEEGKKPIPGIPVAPQGFDDRCYDLFGILADVRNGSGFAGIETGTGWRPIAPDRGLPDDIDPQNPKLSIDPEDGEERWLGDHSFTWIGLDELKAYGWDTEGSMLYGVVSAEYYETMKANGITVPDSYCGGVTGGGIETYTTQEYERRKVEGGLAREPYVRLQWVYSAREATYDWPGKVIPWLEELAAGRPLRLLLGFDS